MLRSIFGLWHRSLSVRLLCLFILTCLVLVTLLIGSARHGFRSQWQFTIKPHLVQYLVYLTEDIGSPPDQQRATELSTILPINIYIEGPDTHFSTINTPLDKTDLYFEPRRYNYRGHLNKSRRRVFSDAGLEIGEHRDRTVLRHRSGDYSVYFELLHLSPAPHNNKGSLAALVALLATLSFCYLLLRRMLRPVADITEGVKHMGRGELYYRVPIRTNNDLGNLAGSINTMASDIEKMLDAKRQLLLGASHELRSPLTRARIATELLPESGNKQRLTDDLLEMQKLIEDLLESEKINQGHSVLVKTPTSLHKLVEQVCSDLAISADANAVSPDLQEISIDRTRFQLLLRNLIGNAITHGAAASKNTTADTAAITPVITATIARDTNDFDTLKLSVADTGTGIDPSHIEQLTEPFYRTDESRTRSTGGFGLGLYLCKLIAEAHGGQIKIDSIPEQGTTVSVLIPVDSPNPGNF